MKKAIVIIQSEHGEHKSSIIRTLSQVLIGVSDKSVLNIGELGLSDSITSVVEVDQLKIGVATQKTLDIKVLNLVNELHEKSCDVILCVTEIDEDGMSEIETFADSKNYCLKNYQTNWSEKLEVNFLTEQQMDGILGVIRTVMDQK